MPGTAAEPLPKDARRSLFVYNLFFPFVFLALLPNFLLRMFRRGNYRDHFGQRLALYSAEDREILGKGGWTWIHSISVGETLGALKIARELHAQEPSVRIVLSVTTTTGFALVRDAESDWLRPMFNPLDFLPLTRRTFDLLKPEKLVLIEGEAWPNLLAECKKRRIPAMLANARLSPKSERGFRKNRAWTGPIFRMLDMVAVQEEADIARWASLGFPAENVRVTGNVKFDQTEESSSREGEFRALLGSLGISDGSPVIVAGSTFDGEEKILARVLATLRKEVPALVLILVPRHIERVPGILSELANSGFRVVRRTAAPREGAGCDILLVDTTGELRDWYLLADVVFVGKSLTAIGGQNPAEPAIAGKPVVFGPHMENFKTTVAHLLSCGAALQVSDEAGLVRELSALLADGELRARMGAIGKVCLEAHRGAGSRTVGLIRGLGVGKGN